MKVTLKEIAVRELTNGYKDNADEGVVAYGGKLDVRPPYQREFVYKAEQRDAVINTLSRGFPLNVMYWSVRDDGNYEIIDGQQRTIAICQYITGEVFYERSLFDSLPDDKKKVILDYKLMVYWCEGTDSEKLDWFRTINIAGEPLTDQELRNAVYHGTWLSNAKRYFSKRNCAAYRLGKDYLTGSAIRQDYLETTLNWLTNGKIEEYMSKNQRKNNADELRKYFEQIIGWVKSTFPNYRREMKGIKWGFLYNEYKNQKLNGEKLEKQVAKLMQDEDVTNKRGVYEYVLDGDERHLNIRAFTDKQKREAYETQKGICPKCKKHFTIEAMEADHIKPWHEGGQTTAENCQMLCKDDNRRKSDK